MKMIVRVWNLVSAWFRKFVGMAESSSAMELREQKVDKHADRVADARKSLGSMQATVKQATRLVSNRETEVSTIAGRKAHFMTILRNAVPDSKDAVNAASSAQKHHLQLDGANNSLNAARKELAIFVEEYETSKQLVLSAQGDVKAAKAKTKDLKRNQASAQRRSNIAKSTSALRGVEGLSDGLADLDEMIETGIDELAGAAFVENEFANEANADRTLDIEIATQASLGDFEAELAYLNSNVSHSPEGDSVSHSPEGDSVSHSSDIAAQALSGSISRDTPPVGGSSGSGYGSSSSFDSSSDSDPD